MQYAQTHLYLFTATKTDVPKLNPNILLATDTLSVSVKSEVDLSEAKACHILGSHSGDDKDSNVRRRYAVLLGKELPKFCTF
jgi:hypothetical protein